MTSSLVEAGGLQLDDAIALRRRLHRQPELGLQLPQTQAAVLESLEGLPLTITTGTATSSVVAVLDGDREGPTMLLRGDMDALPMPEDVDLPFRSEIDGAMHACGHDAHVAMLAGSAHVLSGMRKDIAGRVVFMFQPGEEGHGGAKVMIEEGLLRDTAPDAAFAIHQTPMIPSGMIATKGGAIMASADVLRIVVNARGGHASMPHQTCDPIPIAAEIVLAIQSMITRRIDIFNPAVVTIAKIRAGTTNNVIPETAELIGTIRAVSARTRTEVHDNLRRVAENIALAHGATAEVTIEDGGYPVTVNDDAWASRVLSITDATLGEGKGITMPTPVMGAEDWSYVLEQVPGSMVFLGTMPSDAPVEPNHSNRMVIDEAAMAAGIALYSAVALDHCST
ncbi:MAG TPA: M20 family metallopeptidase [Acidimicrobiales bacterium]|nr:M20 family metallopeptidase [Acidimicrobiales bacterium]